MPANPPEEYISIEELAEEVAAKVGATEGEEDHEEVKFGWATFPRDENGLYYEGRCIRGHLKDCATQVRGFLEPEAKALKAKVPVLGGQGGHCEGPSLKLVVL